MKKVFISQPMRGMSDDTIMSERKRLINVARAFLEDEVDVIDSFIVDSPQDAKPLWFLGKSLELMSEADIAVFAKGWQNYRGCRIEHDCAHAYGIKTIEL